ncbi:MAG TPA: DUF4199 domain-containing protein [Allosphingosinicella sp.]|nr:DUF4199 domain-containing protein [Allosphingosinicella sp.]
MLNKILVYGVIAGLVAGLPLSAFVIFGHDNAPGNGMLIGYTIMLVALSTIFVAIKRHRDEMLGGVIRFWPAFGLGLGISLVAGILYVIAWEASCAIAHVDFASSYAASMIEQKRAAGASAAELARVTAEMERFKVQYANPLFRLPMTFIEIFPVGVLVSLISAGLLRSPRFLPARMREAAAAQ